VEADSLCTSNGLQTGEDSSEALALGEAKGGRIHGLDKPEGQAGGLVEKQEQ
jgi:hypothetical protein